MPANDVTKQLRELYAAEPGRVDELDAPELDYLMLEGTGDPATAFPEAFAALFGVASRLQTSIRARDANLAYELMPPEALFTAPLDYSTVPRDEWPWTILSLQPATPTTRELEDAKAGAFEEGATLAKSVRLGTLREGHCVQTLHLGPYEAESRTVASLHGYMAEHGYAFAGAHHEIYFSDPVTVPREEWRTILRQPVVAKRTAPRSVAA